MTVQRVLVTGGAGFIGSHLTVALLHRGFEVRVLDNLSTGRSENLPRDAHLIRGDVRNHETVDHAVSGVDAVFHVAGQASITKSFDDPRVDLEVNVGGTLAVLEACTRHHVGRLLFASSMTVYGEPEIIPTPESTAVAPISPYGITKLAAERYVHAWATRSDIARPLAVTSFRMFNVYGPRQRLDNPYQGVLAIFLGRLLRSEPIEIHSDGEQERDFVYVGDVAKAWIGVLDNPGSHGMVLNLGSGAPTSVNLLCDTLLTRFGRTREDFPVSYREAQQGDLRRSAADIGLARRVLGWEPATTLGEGLTATVDWARRFALS